MLPWRRHPDAAAFTRFIDEEASKDEARAIEVHLARCSRCQEDLEFFQQVGHAAKELTHPAPPPGLLDEVLARREAGERVILPSAPPPEEENSNRVTVLVGLVLLLAGAAAFFLTSGEAAAGTSALRVLPELPRAGQRIEFEFRAASPLATEERLRLRGWYRTADEPPPRGTLGTYLEGELGRLEAGRFSGELWLPPGAVYTAFVVEDPEGARLESNGGRLWEVLAHDETGRPLLAALRQQFRAQEARHAPATLPIARRMTELYPDRPEGWFYRFVYEQRLFPDAKDSLRQSHRDQLHRLDTALSQQEAPAASDAAALAVYADRLGDEDISARWKERLLEEHPLHAGAIRTRVLAAVRAHAALPDRLLDELEKESRRSGSTSRFLLEQGFRAAVRVKEAAGIHTWGRRLLAQQPALASLVAEHMGAFPHLRGEAADILRERLRSLERPARERREPGYSVADQRRANQREARRLLAQLGRILLDLGAPMAARDTLALAAAEGWEPELLRHLGQSYVRAGDTAHALRVYALAAADPLADAPAPVPIGVRIDRSSWAERVRQARPEVERRILAESDARPLDLRARVFTRDGRPRSLGELADGRTTLLAYCSPLVPPCRGNLTPLVEAAENLAGRGIRAFLVRANSPGSESGPAPSGLAVLHDSRGEAARTFARWEIPQYLVVDRRGRVRFQHTDMNRALRQALAVAEEAERTR